MRLFIAVATKEIVCGRVFAGHLHSMLDSAIERNGEEVTAPQANVDRLIINKLLL